MMARYLGHSSMEEHRQENGYAKFRLEDVGSIPTDPPFILPLFQRE